MMLQTLILSLLTVFIIKGVMVWQTVDFVQVFMVIGVFIFLPVIGAFGVIIGKLMIIDPK